MRYPGIPFLLGSILVGTGLVACEGRGMLAAHQNTVNHMQAMAKQAVAENTNLARATKSELPDVIDHALLGQDHKWLLKKPEKHFDIGVNEMPVRQFFTHLSSLESVNIVVSPGITGSVTLHLNHVTLSQVLDAVADGYGFQIEHRPFGYKIVKGSLVTRIYTMDWLALNRSGSSTMNINDVQGTSLSSSNTTTGSTTTTDTNGASSQVQTTFGVKDQWTEVKAAIDQIIESRSGSKKSSNGSSVTINQANGLVVVRATPAAQKLVAHYLNSLHSINSKQIMIDARIVEVELTKNQEIGISQLGIPFVKWTNSDTSSQLTYQHGTPSNSNESYKDFSNIINTLSTVGHVSLLSSPQVSILNNQKALIKVGQDEYYSMGGTTTYVSTSSGGSDPVESNNLQSFFSGVALDVTPQISRSGRITMHIHPIVSSITTVETQVNGSTLDLPKTKIRETDTVVNSKNGQIIVIGGLISESNDLLHNKVPGFEKSAFNSNRKDTYIKKELFVLLRARIVDDKSWVKELDQVSSSLGNYVSNDLEPS